jgi:hypothetical protein
VIPYSTHLSRRMFRPRSQRFWARQLSIFQTS